MRVGTFILLSLVVTSGCTSYFKRKSCEKLNWYDHGYNVAMAGKRLTGDPEYNACKKVEAEISHSEIDVGWKAGRKVYCSVSGAYKKGQSGESYSFEFCGASQGAKTRASYKKGIFEFCQPGNAYGFGASGKTYQDVCSPKQETLWLPPYKKGRVVFLKGEIVSRRRNLRDIDTEVMDLKSQRHGLAQQMATLPSSQVATTERKYDPDTKTYRTVRKYSEGEDTKNRREDLSWQIDAVGRKIKNARSRQSAIRAEIHGFEREIRTLKTPPNR